MRREQCGGQRTRRRQAERRWPRLRCRRRRGDACRAHQRKLQGELTRRRCALGRLEERGYVTSRVEPPTGRRGGRATKHFEVTEVGISALQAARASMARMWDGLELGRYREAR